MGSSSDKERLGSADVRLPVCGKAATCRHLDDLGG
jgi:hypothetical protein